MEALLNGGFNGVGVQEITARAGVPKGSFYNHFESKEALGAEIVVRYGVGSPRRAVLSDPTLPGLERLRRYFTATTESFVDAEFQRGCLLGNFSAELANQSALIRERLVELYARWTGELASAIRDAQADKSISDKRPPAELAAFILDAFEGALLRARVERSRAPFDRFLDLAFTHILT